MQGHFYGKPVCDRFGMRTTFRFSGYTSTNLLCSIIRCEIMALPIGTQLDSHEITALLGKGGVGVDPPPDRDMVNGEVPLRHDPLKVTIREGVSEVSANTQEDDHIFEMPPPEQCRPFSGHDAPYQISSIASAQSRLRQNRLAEGNLCRLGLPARQAPEASP